MANTPLDKFQILAPPVQFADIGVFIANAMVDALDGAWFFNKYAGESNADAALRCSYNWAPNANNGVDDRIWLGAPPVFQTDYATILNNEALKTGLPDWTATGGCMFTLARTDFPTIAVPSTSRGNLGGSYANQSTARGFGMQLAASSNGAIRCTDYATSAPTTPVNNQANTTADTLNKWRLLFGSSGAVNLKMTNLTGDGTAPNPTAAPLTGGRMPGTSLWHVGGYAATSGYDNIGKHVAFHLRFNRLPTTPEYDTIVAQCRDLMSETAIKELAITP